MDSWRLIRSGPSSGPWNMAVDEVLFEAACAGGRPVLRFYTWETATVSLGYFQRWRELPEQLQGLPLVRRTTGGGAIIHHHELTYALTLPVTHKHQVAQWYRQMHDIVVSALGRLGARTAPRATGAQPGTLSSADRHAAFLCFQRADAMDIVAANIKIAGSAQRVRQGAVLQHGSIILRRSPYAAEIPGLFELVGTDIDAATLVQAIVEDWPSATVGALDPDDLTGAECATARQLVDSKYGNDLWTRKR